MSSLPWSILVHGDAGAGKSWLGNTAPGPRLILDAEGRAGYLPSSLPKVTWDPLKEAPPIADGTWETCVVSVHKFDILTTVHQWLQSGEHPFTSVVVDSLREIQQRFIDNLVGLQQLQTQHWGEILRHLEKTVRDYRDLLLWPQNPLRVVVMVVGTKDDEEGGKKRPLLQGQLRSTLPYHLDTVGYLYVTNDESGTHRNLLVQPLNNIVAKDGTGRLGGPVLQDPNLSALYAHLNGGEPA